MRIGINTLFMVPGDVGGSETYLRETLISLVDCYSEHEYTLFTNRENTSLFKNIFENSSNVKFIEIGVSAVNRALRILHEQFELPVKIKESQIELLWSPGITSPFFTKVPQVVSILDMQYKTFPEDFTFGARLATNVMITGAIRRAKSILTISEFSKTEIAKHLDYPEEKIFSTPLGVSPDFFNEMPQKEARQIIGSFVDTDEPYLLCVAHSYPHKNLPLLIDAYGSVMDEIQHHLVLLGKPRLGEPMVQKALGKLPNSQKIHRCAQVSKRELIALYKGANCFVFPSLYEGFGLPVVEALAAGIPVIAAKIGSVPEVGGSCIRYFEPETADGLSQAIIQAVRMNQADRIALIEQSIARAKQFTWKETAKKTMECFEKSLCP